ncbi:hypothetical protein [Alkalihalobacillus sp. AL-G]|nr:hypothetical protein [Alkalihalobacillus sp. AL-G]WLD94753.1 hypothetical protein MOJ78_07685 [Alkalihalobacillus sp. AL-G]
MESVEGWRKEPPAYLEDTKWQLLIATAVIPFFKTCPEREVFWTITFIF